MRIAPDVSLSQALSVWSDLCDAFHGANGFGGNVAEIYAYRLQTRRPAAEGGADAVDSLTTSTRADQARQAGAALAALLTLFIAERNVHVWIDGAPFARVAGALVREGFDHRVHVRIALRVRRRRPR